jgi:hypothetical protein
MQRIVSQFQYNVRIIAQIAHKIMYVLLVMAHTIFSKMFAMLNVQTDTFLQEQHAYHLLLRNKLVIFHFLSLSVQH